MIVEKLNEQVVAGKRLGRHIEHDPRSRDYAYESDVAVTDYKTVEHRSYGSVLDQGNLGSCTGNACAGAINTAPIHTTSHPVLKEQDAVDLYELATSLDNIPGKYPPDDTGSSGLAVAKAAKEKGYITSYKHAFSLDAALAALQHGPIIIGIPWYEGFDNPDPTGLIEIVGQIRGGHEIRVVGYGAEDNVMDSLIMCINSWGTSYGAHGRMHFTVSTLQTLLEQRGDATILIRS